MGSHTTPFPQQRGLATVVVLLKQEHKQQAVIEWAGENVGLRLAGALLQAQTQQTGQHRCPGQGKLCC